MVTPCPVDLTGGNNPAAEEDGAQATVTLILECEEHEDNPAEEVQNDHIFELLQQSAEGLMILLISIGYGVYIGLGLLSCIVALGTWVSKTIYASCNAVADHRDPLGCHL